MCAHAQASMKLALCKNDAAKMHLNLSHLQAAISVWICTISLVFLAIEHIAVNAVQLFPFGKEQGDANLPGNDDNNSPDLTLSIPYLFFGIQRSSIYINNNGAITFTFLLTSFNDDPFPLTSAYSLVAAFYGDVDTRGSGSGILHYRVTSTDVNFRRQVDDVIHAAFVREVGFVSRSVTVATWDSVGHYNQAIDRLNTFQCVMASDGTDTFVLFLYADIQWTQLSKEENLPQVGFDAGDGVNFYKIPGSESSEGLRSLTNTSNVGVPGMWVFKVSGLSVETGPCTSGRGSPRVVPTTPSPDFGSQLGGNLVSVQGPCFSEGANMQCEFAGQRMVVLYVSDFEIRCIVPRLPRSGHVPFRMLIDGEVRGEGNYTAFCTTGAYSIGDACELCPANTITNHVTVVTECSCIAGFYRSVSQQEGPEVRCTEPPSACTDIQVTAKTRTSLTITWSRPVTTGRSDYYYRVLHSNSDTEGEPDFTVANDNLVDPRDTVTYEVTGLEPSTSYTVRVTTHNGVSDQDPDVQQRQCEAISMTALCSDPVDPTNGGVTVTGNSAGDTATFTCDSNFELVGERMATCTQSTAVFEPTPICRPLCPVPTDPTNGMVVSFTGNSVGDTATYGCNDGFELDGGPEATCDQVDVNSAVFSPVPLCKPQLRIFHGRGNSVRNITYTEVIGVSVLSLDTPTLVHLFDCSTGSDSSSDLVWWKEAGTQRFPTTTQEVTIQGRSFNTLRMDLSAGDVSQGDLGVYTCVDTATDESASVNITGGNALVMPVLANKELTFGGRAELGVYAVAYPPIQNGEIVWTKPRGARLRNGSRLSLSSTARRLVVREVGLGEHGQFRVDIIRQAVPGVFVAVASALITANVNVGVLVASSPVSLTVWELGTAIFSCAFSGNPPPVILWRGTDLGVNTTRPHRLTDVGLVTVTSDLVLTDLEFAADPLSIHCEATNVLADGQLRTATSELAELRIARYTSLVIQPSLNDARNILLLSSVNVATLQITCTGSRDLFWTGTSNTSDAIQISAAAADDARVLSVSVERFSAADIAVYTCTSDYSMWGISSGSNSVLITNDAAIFIGEQVIYSRQGSMASITASYVDGVTVQWYHQDTLINAPINPRYSIITLDGLSTLHITNVDTDVLGTYSAVLDGSFNSNATAQLQLTEPPTATVTPATYRIAEGDTTYVQCLAGGTQPMVVWSRVGSSSLPTGVFQIGHYLAINLASSSHEGQYQCRVTNMAGSDVASLSVESPMLVVTDYRTARIFASPLSKVVAEHGDYGPTFSCTFHGTTSSPTLSWRGLNGGTALPSGVSQHVPVTGNGTSLDLIWERTLAYSDSGQYVCSVVNSSGSATITLDILVKFPLTMVSISPRVPFITGSSPNFRVPSGYTGVVLMCSAMSWPTPTVEWSKNGRSLAGSLPVTSDTDTGNLLSISARLVWLLQVSESDAGDYVCTVRNNDTEESRTVSLRVQAPSTSDVCVVSTLRVHFQIRVLNTQCAVWEMAGNQELISGSFVTSVIDSIQLRCPECMATLNHIEISGAPRCSQMVGGATLVRGTVATESVSQTEDIFCALLRWQQYGPVVSINDTRYSVDADCPIRSSSPTGPECSSPTLSIGLVVGAALAGGVVLLTSTIGTTLFLYWYFRIRSNLPKYMDNIDPEVGNIVSPTGLYTRRSVLEMQVIQQMPIQRPRRPRYYNRSRRWSGHSSLTLETLTQHASRHEERPSAPSRVEVWNQHRSREHVPPPGQARSRSMQGHRQRSVSPQHARMPHPQAPSAHQRSASVMNNRIQQRPRPSSAPGHQARSTSLKNTMDTRRHHSQSPSNVHRRSTSARNAVDTRHRQNQRQQNQSQNQWQNQLTMHDTSSLKKVPSQSSSEGRRRPKHSSDHSDLRRVASQSSSEGKRHPKHSTEHSDLRKVASQSSSEGKRHPKHSTEHSDLRRMASQSSSEGRTRSRRPHAPPLKRLSTQTSSSEGRTSSEGRARPKHHRVLAMKRLSSQTSSSEDRSHPRRRRPPLRRLSSKSLGNLEERKHSSSHKKSRGTKRSHSAHEGLRKKRSKIDREGSPSQPSTSKTKDGIKKKRSAIDSDDQAQKKARSRSTSAKGKDKLDTHQGDEKKVASGKKRTDRTKQGEPSAGKKRKRRKEHDATRTHTRKKRKKGPASSDDERTHTRKKRKKVSSDVERQSAGSDHDYTDAKDSDDEPQALLGDELQEEESKLPPDQGASSDDRDSSGVETSYQTDNSSA